MENVRSVVVVLWNGEEDTVLSWDVQTTHDVGLRIIIEIGNGYEKRGE